MESRTHVAHYAATMTRELCRMCRKVELDDLAYLLQVAAAEATKVKRACPGPEAVQVSAGSRPRSEFQRPGLLHLRQRAHRGQHLRGQVAVDLNQRNGVAAGHVAADMEGRDVDAGVSQRGREPPDEAGLVQIGDVDHGPA